MPAPRIPRQALGVSLAPKNPDAEAPEHLALIRRLHCCVCGAPPPVDPHHLLRIRDAQGNRVIKGTGRTNDDKHAIPLCRLKCHNGDRNSLHASLSRGIDEEEWLAARGIQGRELAKALWAATPDFEAMFRIVFRARQVGR